MLKNALRSLKTLNGKDYHDENQYLHLIDDILREGEMIYGRNGNAKTVCGSSMHFSLQNGTLPLLTTKKVAWKTCLKELLWFISGSTNNDTLREQKVGIWNGNGSREFLDSRGLTHYRENDLGPVYGHQWRHFNAPYTTCDDDYSGKGVDQLQYIIDQLKGKETRFSRRLVMSAWNPCQIDEMALPPCHIMAQFHVSGDGGNRLSCILYQRSGDVGLGVPFNIASYSFLTHLIAHHCGLEAHEFIYHIGNAHIYDDHLGVLKEQIERNPYEFPTLTIETANTQSLTNKVGEDEFGFPKMDTIISDSSAIANAKSLIKSPPLKNINDYKVEHFSISEYNCHEPIQMKMRN
jgi:thymidylate synthase